MPGLATTTEVCSVDTILQEFGQRLRDLLREDLIAKTRGIQGVPSSSFKVAEEGVKQTAHIAGSAVQEKIQIRDQQGEVHSPTGKLRSSVGDSQGGRGSLKYIISTSFDFSVSVPYLYLVYLPQRSEIRLH